MNDALSTGKLTLTLGEDGKWVKPENNVWDPESKVESMSQTLDEVLALTLESQPVGNPILVLPQELDKQTLTLDVTVRTYRDPGDGSGEKLVLTQTGLKVSGSLAMDEIKTWGINQYITYEIAYHPAAVGDGGGPVLIDFDPAVVDWDYIEAGYTIQL